MMFKLQFLVGFLRQKYDSRMDLGISRLHVNDLRPPESWPSLLAYFKGRFGTGSLKYQVWWNQTSSKCFNSFWGDFPSIVHYLGWCQIMTHVWLESLTTLPRKL